MFDTSLQTERQYSSYDGIAGEGDVANLGVAEMANQLVCQAKGGTWDQATKTCTLPPPPPTPAAKNWTTVFFVAAAALGVYILTKKRGR